MRLGRLLFVFAAALAAGCAHGSPSPSGLHVESISPADGSTNVAVSSAVSIVFSKDVHPDSIENADSILVVDSGNAIVRGVFSVDGSTVTFNPSSSFSADSTYGVAVREFVFDTSGGSLKYPTSAVFSTGATISEIKGFPPFVGYPPAPDVSKIRAWLVSGDTSVEGEEGAAAAGYIVNARNASTLEAGSAWAAPDGSFSVPVVGGSIGDTVEVCLGDASTGKTGPVGAVQIEMAPEWAGLAAQGTPPQAVFGHSAVYDPGNSRMIVFGGCTNSTGYLGASNSVYSLDLSSAGPPAWIQLSPSGTQPSARYGHSAVYDPMQRRMIVFGGNTGLLGVLSDVWSLSLAIPGAEAWAQISAAGPGPSARAFHCAAWDLSRLSMTVFGGEDATPLAPSRYSDVWSLSFAASPAWSQAEPSTPLDILGGLISFPPRSGAACSATGSGSMAVAFGFASVSGVPVPMFDAYSLSMSPGAEAWTALSAPPTQTGRGYLSAAFDSASNRIFFFGGRSSSDAYGDLYVLDLSASAWSVPEIPAGTPPSSRSEHSAVWDASGRRMIVFGGRSGLGGSLFGDLHSLRMN